MLSDKERVTKALPLDTDKNKSKQPRE